MLQRIAGVCTGLFLLSALAACTVVKETVDQVGDATSNAVESSTSSSGATGMASMDQMSMQMFRAMFYQGGYALDTRRFEPGEYVQWELEGRGNTEWFRKAMLKRRPDGNEWWRLINKTSDGKIIMEALLEPEDDSGSRRILRLRQKLGPDQKAQEVPITKDNADKWTLDRQRELTEESYKGMKVGQESITVPAGTFQVDHLRSTHPQRGGRVDWYLSERVPGSVVRYVWKSNGNQHTMSLSDYGDGETSSQLGAF